MHYTMGLKNALQQKENGIATIDGTRKRTWREVGARVAKLAGALKDLGLSRGGRVGILSLNCDRYLESYFAVFWAGGVIVPLNARLSVSEIAVLLNDSGCEILLIGDDFFKMLPDLDGKLHSVKHVVCMGEQPAPDGLLSYEEILQTAVAISDAEAGGEDLAGIFYTGGTTGLPKGVMLTHHNLVFNAMNSLICYGYNSDTVYLHAAPMFHLADAGATCSVTMVQGTHVFAPRFIPDNILKIMEMNKVTNVMLVPTMVNMLIQSPNFRNYDLTHLAKILYGAAPMPAEVLKKAIKMMPGCVFCQGYGMTETSPLITALNEKYHDLEGPLSKIESAGKACPTIEVKIVDPLDKEVPRGSSGEIVVRGDNLMRGYWKRPDETEKALRNGWMHTGDAGYMDEDGFVYISDRLKDMIISGGENIYSLEVENVIYQHPAVISCAVIGIPHPQWGESVHAVIVHQKGITLSEQEIIVFCKKQLGGYKSPRSVEFRTDPLPLSGTGKILKNKLREPFWKGREKRVN